jgi:hypothetical protein
VKGHETATPTDGRSIRATPRPGSGSAHGTTLEGILERVTYANEETAWSVVKLAVPAGGVRSIDSSERDEGWFSRWPCRHPLRVAGPRVYGPFALASRVALDAVRSPRLRKSC